MRLGFSGFPMWLATQCACLLGCVWRHLKSFLSVLQNKCSQNPCLLNLTFNIIGSWMGCVCDLRPQHSCITFYGPILYSGVSHFQRDSLKILLSY